MAGVPETPVRVEPPPEAGGASNYPRPERKERVKLSWRQAVARGSGVSATVLCVASIVDTSLAHQYAQPPKGELNLTTVAFALLLTLTAAVLDARRLKWLLAINVVLLVAFVVWPTWNSGP